ncbi:MerR family transcriptional regulator [Catellatospora sp. IY07-71]|uniref:MerR family transcriptional regulator n=1 Tax=Catellatospora sp. IY07-71 TaxID=2728827 RepID=UPI001BB411DE|nr:MerR family transcriptional regulator [Catellatospora sp. IY07-71]BCJ73603.1 MerR family transcriptional regulator [Catellatospora sp. IY07-71]
MEWSIQDVARLAGTTSRTLRHYDEFGLLRPSRVGRNGHRFYDQDCLVRLQRILLLRELGLGLPAISAVLAGQQSTTAALRTHLRLLEHERDRIDRQIGSVKATIRTTEEGEPLMPEQIFDGFDHTRHEAEVTRRWGRDAYTRGDRWWRELSTAERTAFQQRFTGIAQDFAHARRSGAAPGADEVQQITGRLVGWLTGDTPPSREYLLGLGELYAADDRYGANYDRHGAGTALFVRDAMAVYAARLGS